MLRDFHGNGVRPVLVFGYGNPSRGDDALGPAFLERIGERCGPDAECLTDFQLQVEHALDMKDRRLVLFVDASQSGQSPFEFMRLQPVADSSYTTHAISPSAVLEVYQRLLGMAPPASFVLSIRGEQFELGESLSQAAQANLEAALTFASDLLAHPLVPHWDARCAPGSLLAI